MWLWMWQEVGFMVIYSQYFGQLDSRTGSFKGCTTNSGSPCATSDLGLVATVIRQYMVSISGTLGYTPSQYDLQQTFGVQPSRHRPWEPVPKRGARGGIRGTRRLSRDTGSYIPLDPFDNSSGDALAFTLGLMLDAPSHLSGVGTSYVPPDPFDSPDASDVPPPPLSVGEEHGDEPVDDVTLAQQLGFGHRVGKKTTRFTPSDWH
ncbi:hypothetical protein M9H77_23737 [Catharanthus roseus]|uniref:Uncharacterized protein n=1 Tax=Catharanthus roseus TaxID=4058 RepID=A0ACC0AV47_CATRO|nr:hypothetical protein M9H77_23737 [Catharanthus roseus]